MDTYVGMGDSNLIASSSSSPPRRPSTRTASRTSRPRPRRRRDRDLYFRDVVTALAVRGWDSFRITIAIAARVWIPERYAGHLEEWGIKPVIAAQAWVSLRSTDEAAPNATQSNAAADVEVAVQTNVADVAASDLRAVQRG